MYKTFSKKPAYNAIMTGPESLINNGTFTHTCVYTHIYPNHIYRCKYRTTSVCTPHFLVPTLLGHVNPLLEDSSLTMFFRSSLWSTFLSYLYGHSIIHLLRPFAFPVLCTCLYIKASFTEQFQQLILPCLFSSLTDHS
jgi:hypothetical protein